MSLIISALSIKEVRKEILVSVFEAEQRTIAGCNYGNVRDLQSFSIR